MKKWKSIICIFLSVFFFIPTVQAEDITQVIASLSDDALIELCSMAMVEAYSRGISPQILADKIAQEYQRRQTQPTPKPEAQIAVPGTLNAVREAVLQQAYEETTISYEPTPTTKPTFAPLIQLADNDIVYISRTGERYHTTPVCSGMTTAHAVTLEQAIDSNHTPCRDCAYWMPETEE